MQLSKRKKISNIATYTLLSSALGIGVLLLMFSIIPVLTGAVPPTSIQAYVWIALFLLIVSFVLSLIYCLLDIAQIAFSIKRRDPSSPNMEEIQKQQETVCEDTQTSTKEPTEESETSKAEKNETPVVIEAIKYSEQEKNLGDASSGDYAELKQLFHEKYVHADYKDRPVYDMFVELFEIECGGKYFMLTMYSAFTSTIITRMPSYKDACYYFGEERIGSKSNYSYQYKYRIDIPNTDLLNMRKVIDSKLKELEKKK